MIRNIVRSAITLAVIGGVTAGFVVPTVASSESDPQGRQDSHPAVSQAVPPTDLPLAAFKRSPGPADSLPPELSGGTERITGQPGGESRLMANINGTRVYAQLAGSLVCFGAASPESIGSMTCNTPDGLDRGWFILESQDDIVGLVDDATKAVELLDAAGARIRETQVVAGAYVVPGAAGSVAAIRFDPNDGLGPRTLPLPTSTSQPRAPRTTP